MQKRKHPMQPRIGPFVSFCYSFSVFFSREKSVVNKFLRLHRAMKNTLIIAIGVCFLLPLRDGHTQSAEAVQAVVSRIQSEIEEIRGLEFKRPVRSEEHTSELQSH